MIVIAAQQLPILYIQAEKFRNSFRDHLIKYDQSNGVTSNIVKLISIQPMELEHLLSKVLVIDRTTVYVVNSTWQDGMQITLKL